MKEVGITFKSNNTYMIITGSVLKRTVDLKFVDKNIGSVSLKKSGGLSSLICSCSCSYSEIQDLK